MFFNPFFFYHAVRGQETNVKIRLVQLSKEFISFSTWLSVLCRGKLGFRARVWGTDLPSLRLHMKGYGASVEWYWHGLVRYPDRNFCQCYFVHDESHMECPGSEARPLRSEAGYHTAGGLVTTETDSCHMTDPIPNGFIWNLFMHGGVSWVAVWVRLATWETQRYSDSISRHPKSRRPSWRFIYEFEWSVWRDTEL